MMTRYERLNAVLELLAEHGHVEIDETAERLGCSTATLRRDLDHLAEQQLLTRTRGGAVASAISYDLPLRYKTARKASEKQRIAVAAAAMVTPGMTVGLNGGTTTTEIARAIAGREELVAQGAAVPVTIVTNALNIASEMIMRPHLRTVATGGMALPNSYELVGPIGAQVLRTITLDLCFLGVGALDPEFGATAFDDREAHTNQLMAARAQTVVAVADSSKLGRRTLALICEVGQIAQLITDDAATPHLVARFTAAGVRVTLV
jgi:DeoR/GlpR family transcriptional regulator of sugar metabolism